MNVENNHIKQKVIVGLGQTGLSCAKYLARENQNFSVLDSRQSPPGLEQLKQLFPEVKVKLGEFKDEDFALADEIIMSPGVDLRLPVLQKSIARGVAVTGDIDIFAKATKSTIVAVTGSNAKSTVVTMVGEMAKEAGINVAVAGNIGQPVLDLMVEKDISLFVLELSSFQLETTTNLCAEVASVLNISPDHQDRYDSMQAYHKAKHRIFQGCKQAVINRDDLLSQPLLGAGVKQWHFGLEARENNEFGTMTQAEGVFLSYKNQALLNSKELKIVGQHNISNALAGLALGNAVGIEFEPMLTALKSFTGLPHRCQWVAERAGVNYYNDSKGTNVGACIAAVESLAEEIKTGNKLILIAGGVSKDADFSKLAASLKKVDCEVIVFGQDAGVITLALDETVLVKNVKSLEEAVRQAQKNTQRGDFVLLSPACASFDMFSNYEERGAAFVDAVNELH